MAELPPIRRRTFIGGAAAAGIAASGGLSPSAAQAMTGPRERGRLDDVRHVVILMQENRSFDHYYGTMRGVRGWQDRTALRLPGGRDVFHQPDAHRTDGGFLLPFHVDTAKVDGQDLGDLDHSWDGTHLAWDGGNNDNWIPPKTELTMGYFTRSDIPFHRALAEAFTTCDAYFCSVQGPTTPNRLYLWSGMIDPNATGGGPVITNPDDYLPVFTWTTYPERLQAAGISWQVYANNEVGDDPGGHPFVGDFGDNPLWLFQAYHDSLNATDPAAQQLAARAAVTPGFLPDSGQGKNVDHVLAQFIADCRNGTLPDVSWIVAPYGYSEHPAARPVDGAAYTQGVLQALFDNPELWRSTVVLIDYDENDGFFDHLIPPVAPPGTPDEFVQGRPIGLGPRVPMTVISPWSRGGWVNSQVFDHTSVIRFLEAWTGVREPNISAWRREICGDLTSCFDFVRANTTIPLLPDTATLRAQADLTQPKLPTPTPPAVGAQAAPVQEAGVAPARAIPYQPVANLVPGPDGPRFDLANLGEAALQLGVYSTVGSALTSQRVDLPRGHRAHSDVAVDAAGAFDAAVHGPNGFVRRATGSPSGAQLDAVLTVIGPPAAPRLRLALVNRGGRPLDVTVQAGREGERTVAVPAHRERALVLDPVRATHGWYDVTVTVATDTGFLRTFGGHLENGRPSVTG